MTADAVLRALAEPHRRRILTLVADREVPAGEIAQHFDITHQAVSQHLKVLRDAGLLNERRDGTRRLYAIRPEAIESVRAYLDELWPASLAGDLTDAELMVRWMGQWADLHPKAGGVLAIDVNGVPIRGEYLVVEPPHRVVFSWGAAGSDVLAAGSTTVEIMLRPDGAGTVLELVHRGLPPEELPRHGIGWGHFLERLVIAASGGEPGPDPWAAH